MTPGAGGARPLAVLLAALLASAALAAPPKKTPPPRPTAAAAPLAPEEEVYELGRDALSRGSFGVALRLFRSLVSEPRFERDPRLAFNLAQAARFSSEPGEAFVSYARYLTLDPAAADAATVREQLARLAEQRPADVRRALVEASRRSFARSAADREVEVALSQCPLARLLVRFARREGAAGAEADLAQTSFAFGGRAVLWQAPPAGAPGPWTVWIVPTAPLAPPEDLALPALLFLPAGEAIAFDLGNDLASTERALPARPHPGIPAGAEAGWSIHVRAEIERVGPPVFVVGSPSAGSMADVRSAPSEPTFLLGKRRHDLPLVSTPLAAGPRQARAESKTYAGLPVVCVDLPVKEGTLERWAAPVSSFDVVNRFARLSPDGTRLLVRADGSGPSLPVFSGGPPPR